MNSKNIAVFSLGILMAGSLAIASVASAATQQGTVTPGNGQGLYMGLGRGMRGGTPPAHPALTGFHYRIIGQITAINGNTVTVKDSAGKTFTVDAANANIMVNGTKSTVSVLAVNDQIVVGGRAADGTTTQITANNISKGTAKVDLSTIKNNRGEGRGMGMGEGMGMGKGKGRGMGNAGSFTPVN